MTPEVLEAVALAGRAVLFATIGATAASFTAVVGMRAARRESPTGRSRCACGRPLAARELVPIVSWLACGGQAWCCHTRIPAALVVGEAAAALVAGAAAAIGGWRWGVDAVVLVSFAVTVRGYLSERAALRRASAQSGGTM